MKKNNIIFMLFIVIIVCASCGSEKNSTCDENREGPFIFRSTTFTSDHLYGGRKLAKDFYDAVYAQKIEIIKELLLNRADPDYCFGESGWIDSNPLNVVVDGFYDTYYRHHRGELIPIPIPDITILDLLVQAGVDIHRRPYIWDRVNRYNNNGFDDIKRQRKFAGDSLEPEAVQEQIDYFISDSNRLIEVLLMAGSDPDRLGHPYPYSYEAVQARITDEQANEYFAKGSRAINVAIEKGMAWESQIDLLLKYTKLDEESLKAAERSNNPAMVEKIQTLWTGQQAKSNR